MKLEVKLLEGKDFLGQHFWWLPWSG